MQAVYPSDIACRCWCASTAAGHLRAGEGVRVTAARPRRRAQRPDRASRVTTAHPPGGDPAPTMTTNRTTPDPDPARDRVAAEFTHVERLSRQQAAERLVDIAYALTAGATLELRTRGERVNVPVADEV